MPNMRVVTFKMKYLPVENNMPLYDTMTVPVRDLSDIDKFAQQHMDAVQGELIDTWIVHDSVRNDAVRNVG